MSPAAPSASTSPSSPPAELDCQLKDTAWQFALAVATGIAREIACFGARGDGKSWAALWAMVMHAVEHHRRGYSLPTTWLGLRDTFANHRLTTKKSLQGTAWPRDAHWVLSDGDHLATFMLHGVPFVELYLIGADSPSDAERVRTECHGLWIDEPAPAMGMSAGISEELYLIACSSQRLETHAHVAMLTSNYSEEDHWVATRFWSEPQPGTAIFRIPEGERASEEYRNELKRLYATRPDLARRLVDGQFGSVILGEQVATGFNQDVHAPRTSRLTPSASAPLLIGQDGGLTPTSVIGQRVGPYLNILASLHTEHGGIQQHVKYLLRPWIAEHAPWALQQREHVQVYYDPSMNKDDEGNSDSNSLQVMRAELMGLYHAGKVEWEDRKNPILALFNAMVLGQPVLRVDPVQARGLVKALNGGWHYATGGDGKVKRDLPVKDHPHSDHGDAFCYLVGGARPLREQALPTKRMARMVYDVLDHGRQPGKPVVRTA